MISTWVLKLRGSLVQSCSLSLFTVSVRAWAQIAVAPLKSRQLIKKQDFQEDQARV